MARNLDVILDLATLAWKSGARADTIIRLLQDVGVDEPATAEPVPDYRGEVGHSDSGLTGPPGTMLFGGTDPKPAKPE